MAVKTSWKARIALIYRIKAWKRNLYKVWKYERGYILGRLKGLQVYFWAVMALLVSSIMTFNPTYVSRQLVQPVMPVKVAVSTTTPARTPTPALTATPTATVGVTGDWTTYMANDAHTGFNAAENIITPATAPNLKLKWTYRSGGDVVSQPVVANGIIYWGSWDGYEYATTVDNKFVWRTFLGREIANPICIPPRLGVTSTATIASVTINGTPTLVDFLGGADGYFYALNARTGAVIWKTFLGQPPGYYLWSSPVFYNGNIYMGASSLGDCPLVQGKLVEMNPATGSIEHVLKIAADGCIGGGIWTSPTVDEATGIIYVTTGTKDGCYVYEKYAMALLAVQASDLKVLQSWQIPKRERVKDGDFGATATLFTTSTGVPMVGVDNKNSIYYAFRRDDLSHPIWETRIGTRHGTISSSAWDGHRLYVGARKTYVNGKLCPESVVALDPDSGAILWRYCMQVQALIGAITAVPGLVIFGQAQNMIVLDAASGKPLYIYQGQANPNQVSLFRGWASVAHGVIYIGGTDNKLYAFSP